MARKKQETKTPVDAEMIERALARAVSEGDIVVLRQLFAPWSPLRDWNSESLASAKYDYMRPPATGEEEPGFREALMVVKARDVINHARDQLRRDGPPQIHADLVMALADTAVRLGKFSSAAQAYEMLRIRPRMQEEFLKQGDAALDQGSLDRAVNAYRIGSSLAYNYAAFPEPLPLIPDYQKRALILHAHYPTSPETCVAMQPPETFVKTTLSHLLLDAEIAARLDKRPLEQRSAIAVRLVRMVDPDWEAFVRQFRDACKLVTDFGKRLKQDASKEEAGQKNLEEEIEELQAERHPREIEECLLGRKIENGEWWQYMQEMAYEHPASVLFVARQALSNELEILMPRLREDNPLAGPLGLSGTS